MSDYQITVADLVIALIIGVLYMALMIFGLLLLLSMEV